MTPEELGDVFEAARKALAERPVEERMRALLTEERDAAFSQAHGRPLIPALISFQCGEALAALAIERCNEVLARLAPESK